MKCVIQTKIKSKLCGIIICNPDYNLLCRFDFYYISYSELYLDFYEGKKTRFKNQSTDSA